MAYGSLVVQLIQDYEDYGEVNKQLEKMYVPFLSNGGDAQLIFVCSTGDIILGYD